MTNTNEKDAEKIIVDTNILYLIYGATFEKNADNPNLKRYRRFLKFVEHGFVELCITPQILEEFTVGRGLEKEKIDRFGAFVSNYLTVLTLNPRQERLVADLTYHLGHTPVRLIDPITNKPYRTVLTKKASGPGKRNYPDTKIMAEAAMFDLPILTNNTNDFVAYYNIDKLTKNYKLKTRNNTLYNFKEYTVKVSNRYHAQLNEATKK